MAGDKRASVFVNIYWPETVHALRQFLELPGAGSPPEVTDAELERVQTVITNARKRLAEQEKERGS